MSHDEETEVRQRLRRLTETAVAPPPRPEAQPGGVPRFGVPSTAVGSDVLSARPAAPASEPTPGESAVAPGSRLPGPGAFDPGRRGVRALAVVAVVVVLVAAGWAWRSRPQSEPVAPPVSESTAAASVGDPSASGFGELVVTVAGKVRKPGLVRLPAGSRLADAVQAAGGALPGVDVALLNPARKVTDGELIVVGVTPPPGGPAAPPGGGAAPATGPLNLNTATLAQLDALPGVGPVLAQRILAHRDQHGGFKSVGDLRQVDGIGDARYEQLKDLVTV
ncbi:helix-hairpin-helix domain-containing protein [Micromonospora sp. WMMC250]|uniref:helix-hairpin-helix domain-containing protein n=1 Tax=Micromonospora sp. WMMC250 TaxID=3014781 RepID=UPI0022B5EC50|nr:helix-hairpin-helix domain-containing protein [Micromonospora sp. WMMC250]MCZ7378942.1 helix-hairpin-helix domain-containing protein [Micromonospora sp. WMMC250]